MQLTILELPRKVVFVSIFEMSTHKYQDQFRIKKRKQRVFKLSVFAGGIFLVLAGFIYVLFFADFFDVRLVAVIGSDNLPKTEISDKINTWLDERIWGIKRRDNYLVFPVEKLSGLLTNQFLKIKSVNISKKSNHDFEVNVSEHQPDGIWCFAKNSKCFYYNTEGVAYEEVPDSEGFIFTKVVDSKNDNIQIGAKVALDLWLRDIKLAHDLLKKGELNPIEVTIPENSINEFDIKVSQGWLIYFSTLTDISGQINALFSFLKNKLVADKQIDFQYIDLRIEDRIYYK